MKRNLILTALITVAVVTGCGSPMSDSIAWKQVGAARRIDQASTRSRSEWHTRPDRWDEPRVYHPRQSFGKGEWKDYIRTSRVQTSDIGTTNSVSPNGAYWYSLSKTKSPSDGWSTVSLKIFNERDYTVLITMQKTDPRYGPEVKWVNEKLLFIRTWRGRVVGYDLLFDVEAEEIIRSEVWYDGKIPWQQWKHAKEKGWIEPDEKRRR